ncbi:sigma-54 interaction domain-containing protein [Amaricoccus tamworthensis]|uniref:sigma-54 interaction domain-containing protein n=1 Tax=Amaricoccus tamworthensis TaxID=57002 RepID=UPI003C7CAE71
MAQVCSDQPVFDILNFADCDTGKAFARDVDTLGYGTRVHNGGTWLKQAASPRGPKLVVLNGQRDPGNHDILEKLGATPWICVVNRRGGDGTDRMMRAATDFLEAPWSTSELGVRLEHFVAGLNARRETVQVCRAEAGIVGNAANFTRVLDEAERIAASAAPVVIEGETGTGKELVARLINRLSGRRGAFVAVNCGCIPSELVENELFGHEAGAFTGATSARTGLVQQADGGTLFLDEIDTLGPRAQVALLRFLQQGEVRPVGGGQAAQVDVRILTASNRPLASVVAAGQFREDLFFRLNVLALTLPPLRERLGDVTELARHFITVFRGTYNRSEMVLSPDAARWLEQHDLPGNVRQLENLIHRAVLNAPADTIRLADILPPGTTAPATFDTAMGDFDTARSQALARFERRYLQRLMEENGGNVTAAAARAGKERRTLGRLLKKHRIGPHWETGSHPG